MHVICDDVENKFFFFFYLNDFPGAMYANRGGSGTSQMGGQWGTTIPAGGGWPQYAPKLRILLYFAAELRLLLVYLSESLGRLGQNGGPLGGTFFMGAAAAPVEPTLQQLPWWFHDDDDDNMMMMMMMMMLMIMMLMTTMMIGLIIIVIVIIIIIIPVKYNVQWISSSSEKLHIFRWHSSWTPWLTRITWMKTWQSRSTSWSQYVGR